MELGKDENLSKESKGAFLELTGKQNKINHNQKTWKRGKGRAHTTQVPPDEETNTWLSRCPDHPTDFSVMLSGELEGPHFQLWTWAL